MSYENKDVWVGKAGDHIPGGGEMAYESLEGHDPKRPYHQWFLDGSDTTLFPNKRPSLHLLNNNNNNNNNNHFFPGISSSTLPLWGNGAGFHPVSSPFTDRLFVSETGRPMSFDPGNVTTGDLDMNSGRKMVEEEPPFGMDPPFGLSMSQSSLDGPRSGLTFSGIRKVKVNQVKDMEQSTLPLSIDLCRGVQGQNDTLSEGPPYGNIGEGTITMGLSYGDGIGQTYPQNGGGFMSVGPPPPFGKPDPNIIMDLHFGEDEKSRSISRTLCEGGQGYGHTGVSLENFSRHGRGKSTADHGLPVGQPFGKGVSGIISFGGFHEEDDGAGPPPRRLLCGYDLLMGQPSSRICESLGEGDIVEPKPPPQASAEKLAKKREEKAVKKVPPNNFPSNVRSLLSTGMLDGVPVKYIAWSREKELRGVIKGSGYLCGCLACNFGKVINAYELERHASCKTKHPNNHIYFENGKTIYGVVQELRSTPQAALFDVVQTITGSAINQKSFRIWKESFMAATRELQRIYGKDDGQRTG